MWVDARGFLQGIGNAHAVVSGIVHTIVVITYGRK
jgi:hypothetical protein